MNFFQFAIQIFQRSTTYRFFISLEFRHSIFNVFVCVVYTSGWPIVSFVTRLRRTTAELISSLRSIGALEISISIVVVTFWITIIPKANVYRNRSVESNFSDEKNKVPFDGQLIAPNKFTCDYRDSPAYRDRWPNSVCHGYHLDGHVVHDDHLQLVVKIFNKKFYWKIMSARSQ